MLIAAKNIFCSTQPLPSGGGGYSPKSVAVVKIDGAAREFVTRLTALHGQFRSVGVIPRKK